MTSFLSHERFGKPQVWAGLLLLTFLGQCCWLLGRGARPLDVDSSELFRVEEGLAQWRGERIAGTPSTERLEAAASTPPEIQDNDGYDPDHSPLWYLIAAVGLVRWQGAFQMNSVSYWGWLARLPYIVFGVLLGASLWYVARRLYGNPGGYIALTLYCFSPAILRSSTLWLVEPEMAAAWGTFGAIFTAIAVAHTLYAPREVVLWNWRRIVLLGLSLALAIGCQFSMIVLVPMALAFMFYVAPERRAAALAIWAAACGLALLLLLAAYGFHAGLLWQGIRHARLGILAQAFAMSEAYGRLFLGLSQAGPALLVALPVALIAYFTWPRARYFGNTAPLLVAVTFLVLAVATPHYPGAGFRLMAVPFLYVFVAGISADLLETRQRGPVMACISGLLIAGALWNLLQVLRVGAN
jgi:hypothetical protein